MSNEASPILVLTTGGTIDKTYFDALSTFQVGESQVTHLLEMAGVVVPFHVSELMRKDSLELVDEDLELIARAVTNAEATRIIITHGTDTMTKTAAHLKAVAGKTVVFVGALVPARFREGDAVFNLGMAFATVQIAPPGVYITMNGTVFKAGEVVKDRSRNAFVPL